MFLPNKMTFMQAVSINDIDDFVKSISIDKFVQSHEISQPVIEQGALVFDVNYANANIQRLLQSSRVVCDRDKLKYDAYPKAIYYQYLMDDVSKSIMTVAEDASLEEALKLSNIIYEKLQDKLYGILLVNDKNIYNILHPTIAAALCIDQSELKDMKFRVLVYVYNDRAEMDSTYYTSYADESIIANAIEDLTNLFNNEIEETLIKIENHTVDENGNVKISYRESMPKGMEHLSQRLTSSDKFKIAIHQILTKGIFIPHYGASLLKNDRDRVSGCNMSPMLSSNISHDYSYANGKAFDSKYQKENNYDISPSMNSVCTGSHSNRTITGLRTLTHSNASSAYNKELITAGTLKFVDECIKKSLSLYIEHGLIRLKSKEIIQEPSEVNNNADNIKSEEKPKRKRRTKSEIESDNQTRESLND